MAEKVQPPPGLGYSTRDPKELETGKVVGNDKKDLSKYQLKRIESQIPDSMQLYETNPYVQALLVVVTWIVAIANLAVNFQMLQVYLQQQTDFNAAKAKLGPNAGEVVSLAGEYNNRTDAGEYLCDAAYFGSSVFSLAQLQSTVDLSVTFAYVSCYAAAIVFVPTHLIFKALNGYFMATRKFTSGPPITDRTGTGVDGVETPKNMLRSMGARNDSTTAATGGAPAPVVMTRAGQHSLILENEDEKDVRVFLRGESILFAWVQGFQDIPQGTLAALYIILQRSIRGVYCYDTYQDVTVVVPQEYTEIDSTAYLMIGLIFLSTAWNILMLGSRWIKFFEYKTVKYEKKPRPLGIRLAVAGGYLLVYMLAVATPVFALTYTGLGKDLIGYGDEVVFIFFILTIVGGVCAASGFFLIFCWWGTNCSEGVCVTCVVLEAFGIAFGAFECCEFCELCGCCC